MLWTVIGLALARDASADAMLQRLTADLVPLVEAAAGAPFTAVPEVVLADRGQLARVVYDEQRYLLGALTEQSDAEADAAAQRTAEAVAQLFAGKYGFLDKRLYLSLEAIAEAIASRGADPSLAVPMVQLVLAHELAHALQDQHADLDALVVDAPSGDAVMAANCLVEGHAVFVHEAVGDALGLGDAVALMADLLGYADPSPATPDRFASHYVYGRGRSFVRWHAEAGGTERLWAVLRAPPSRTAEIVHPDRWGAPPPAADPQLARRLGRATTRLGDGRWAAVTEPLGDFRVREQLVRAGIDADIDAVHDAVRARAAGASLLGVELQVIRFTDAGPAVAWVHALERQARAQAVAAAFDPHVDASISGFDAIDSDAAARERVHIELPGASDAMGTIWLARGGDVVQVILVNTEPTDREVRRALRPVLRALER